MISRDVWGEVMEDALERIPPLIERDYRLEFPSIRRAFVLTGPRRSGKTFLLYQFINKLVRQGIPKRKIAYVNLEDPRLIGIGQEDLMRFKEVAYERGKSKDIVFFMDEVQVVDGWERFVRHLLDMGHKVAITGSSSRLLSTEVASVMRGRGLPVNVWPFSFAEVLRAHNITPKKYYSSSEKSRIKGYLTNYIQWGGFPEVVLQFDKRREILRDILELTIFRDIVERWNVENIYALRLLIKMIAHSSYLSLSSAYRNMKGMGIKIGKQTLANYMDFLSDAMIFFPLPMLGSYKHSMFKPYMVDPGLLSITGVLSETRLLENTVFVELLRRGYFPGESLFYVAGPEGEVDFVIKKNETSHVLIQVTYTLERENLKREIEPLLRYSRKIGGIPVLIAFEMENIQLPEQIKVYTLEKWLTGESLPESSTRERDKQ